MNTNATNQEIDALGAQRDRLAKLKADREAHAAHQIQSIPIPSLRNIPFEPDDSALATPELWSEGGQTSQNQPNEPDAKPTATHLQPDANPLQSTSNPSEPKGTRRPFTSKHGPLGILNELPVKDQDRIMALLDGSNTFHQVSLALAQPPPDGMNLQVGIEILRRFKKRHTLRLRLQFQADLAHEARATLGDSDATGQDLTEAAARLLKMELLEEAIRADHNLAQLTQLSAILHKHRQTDLAERRLALAEKKDQK